RTRRTRPKLSVALSTSPKDYLVSRTLLVEDVRKPKDLVHRLEGIGKVGEYLHVIRPLIYVLAIRKWGNRAWRPWIISLIIELLSRYIAYYYYTTRIPGGHRWLSTLEKEEQMRRLRQLWYYLLRGPLYEKFTKIYINGFCDTVSTKPLISLLGSVLRDYQPLWENIHYYTSS
ncbi:10362_t:CDS:2, partial [Paraglomus occultum]